MRLLNSSTLELKEFYGDTIPPYAILSHRWLEDEVSLKDMQDSADASLKAGFAKIKLCCAQAVKDGFQYAWVDTCCIDKSSSAELTEAINSMYQWYADAAVCYAYLSDVTTANDLAKSAWFTRGWTLQELIAPANVEFYNSRWEKLGTKITLQSDISKITSIDEGILLGATDIHDVCVARRMSWAAGRTTTRGEDRAYSLLGLFGVNMPMLYGEGKRAFIRLQEEILRRSDDQSLFAWNSSTPQGGGLLATSPDDFSNCHNAVLPTVKWNRQPYSLTNMGLSLQMPIVAWAADTYLVALDCVRENTPDSRVGIYLQLMPESGDQYGRISFEGGDIRAFNQALVSKVQYRNVYVRQRDLPRPVQPTVAAAPVIRERLNGFWIRTLPRPIKTVSSGAGEDGGLSEVVCANVWSDEERIVSIPAGSSGTACSIWYKMKSRSQPLKLGFDAAFNPIVQFGGHLFSPVKPPMDPRSEEAQMDPSWMSVVRSDYLYRGDRLKGLKSDGWPYKISIQDEVVEGRRMWVVDIEEA